jgi:predicted nuclease of predicted toxin-antitoxin system
MKFLLDVNASGSLARFLQEKGHDIALVGDKNPRMKDYDILSWAMKERRIIVTTDNDFEEMIWRQNIEHYGVLRIENLPRSERLSLLRDVLEKHSPDLESRAIVIASNRKIRVRKSS